MALMSKKSLVDKSLFEMKKQCNKMQEEWKIETTTWEAKEKAQNDKLQELKVGLQHIKDLPTSEESSKALITLIDENAALKAEIAAMQVTIDGKYAEFSQQISKGEHEMIKWTEVVKKGTTPPKKDVISKTLEEERRRSHKSMNVLVRGMETGDTPLADAQSLSSLTDVNLTCDSAWRVGKGMQPRGL